MKHIYFLLTLFLLPLLGCNTSRHAFFHELEMDWRQSKLPQGASVRQTLFLLGDAAEGEADAASPVLSLLSKQLREAGENSAVVFLGGNAPAANRSREKGMAKAEEHLRAQLAALEGYQGKTFFLPGETDWNNGKPDGREAVRWQEEFVEKQLGSSPFRGSGGAFLPGGGCGKPEKVKLEDDIVLLFADSQWWLENPDRAADSPFRGSGVGCEDAPDRLGFLEEMQREMKKHDKENLVVLMHHPLQSNGRHGGSFSLKHHLFPLTMWRKNLYLPLPGIGSLAVAMRQAGAWRQDAAHSEYLRLRQELLNISEEKPRNQRIIFAGAHDHSLQLFSAETGRQHFLVSGSAGKADFARGGHSARFVQAREGFAKISFFENGEAWLEFVAPAQVPSGNDKGGEVLFRKKLFDGVPASSLPLPLPPLPLPLPDSFRVAASEFYRARGLRKLALGDRYREAWHTPVTAPVFNLNTEFEHLKIVGQGGGMSSKSLTLEDSSGRQFVLRSVEKSVRGGLPKEVQRTLAEDLIQDLKSGSHPYAAFAVPPLADAAGVYHANPRLFYLPRQPRLEPWNDLFAGELYLFEERLDEDWSDQPSLGGSPDLISFLTLLEKLRKSPKHRLDARQALRSRLFDQWINDYDRHDDQWRWATLPQADSTVRYAPVPSRDRDQAFFDLRGAVPFVLSRRWMARQSRGFYGKIHDVPGQAYSAKNFDRTFLTSLSREDWRQVAEEMKASLTDSVIEAAFRVWQPEIHRLHARQIIETLKQRRDRIPVHAEKLYRFLARYADVTGTDKRDLFELRRLPGGDAELRVFALNKHGERKEQTFHRVFKKGETRELRLYGLDGEDVFQVTGKARGGGVRVRCIGGEGEDSLDSLPPDQSGRSRSLGDESRAGGFFKKTFAYDTRDGMAVEGGGVADRRENRLKVNQYDRGEFRYNRYLPLVTFGRTLDDGLLFGGGLVLTYYRFRKQPYGIRHRVFMRCSANTNALNLQYSGDFTRVLGTLDFNPSVSFDRPVIFNFFGFGNGSQVSAKEEESSHYHWVRLEKLSVQPLLKKTWYNGRNHTRFGGFFERIEVEERAGRITGDAALFSAEDLAEKNFAGVALTHQFSSVDNNSVPRDGMKFNAAATWQRNLGDRQHYARLEGSFTSYATFGGRVKVTFATRFGASTLAGGRFPFYHAASLGGSSHLRGFRNNRFTGRSLFFHNTDLRVQLGYLRNHVMPFEFGVVAGFDYGRVWHPAADEADDGSLHAGFSPGIWLTPYKFAAVTAFYTLTNGGEEDALTLRLGFFF